MMTIDGYIRWHGEGCMWYNEIYFPGCDCGRDDAAKDLEEIRTKLKKALFYLGEALGNTGLIDGDEDTKILDEAEKFYKDNVSLL